MAIMSELGGESAAEGPLEVPQLNDGGGGSRLTEDVAAVGVLEPVLHLGGLKPRGALPQRYPTSCVRAVTTTAQVPTAAVAMRPSHALFTRLSHPGTRPRAEMRPGLPGFVE